MAVNWGLAEPQGGGFDYLQSLQALGQQATQKQALQQRDYAFQQQRQQDQARVGLADRVRAGDYQGAGQEAALGGDFDFAKAIGGLHDDHIQQLGRELDTIGLLHPQLKQMPVEARAAAAIPVLKQAGFSDAELAQVDWSDAGLDQAYALSAQGKAALAARVKAQTEAYTLNAGDKRFIGTEMIADNPKPNNPDYIFDSESGSWLMKPGTGTGPASMAQPGYAGSGGSMVGAPTSGRGDVSRLINSDAGGGYLPPSVRTLGQFVDYGRDMNKRGAKSSSAGTYQINGTTMAQFAPRVLGPGWRDVPFDAQAQDQVGKAIFDWAKIQPDPAAALRGRWVSLNRRDAAQLVRGDWEQARGIIAQGETGGAPGASASASSGSQQQQPGVINVRPPKAKDGNAPSGYRFNGDKLEPIPGGPADPTTSTNRNVQSNRKAEADLRKEFNSHKDVQNFNTARQQFYSIRDLAKKPNPTAQDDIAIIFGFMKTLDPGSTVREGEFATAQNAGGVDDKIVNLYNKARDGQRLNPEQRRNMVRAAYSSYNQFRDAYNRAAENFQGYAKDYGLNPRRVAPRSIVDKPATQRAPARPIAPGEKRQIGAFTVEAM